MFEKNFEKKVENIGNTLIKVINEYDNLVEEADVELKIKLEEIGKLQRTADQVVQAKAKAARISDKLKDIFGD